MIQRKPKQQPRPQSHGFDMAMAALVVILEDEAEEAAKEDSLIVTSPLQSRTALVSTPSQPLRRA